MKISGILPMLALLAGPAQATTVLFQDNFTPAAHPDTAKWTTVIGPGSFPGRTQLANRVTQGASFPLTAAGAQLSPDTFNPTDNPTDFSTCGRNLESLNSFLPKVADIIEFSTTLQSGAVQPGVVYGIDLYGCPNNCANVHDEIEIELVTNKMQGQSPCQVQLNRYAADLLGAHTWKIRWLLTAIGYYVDHTLLRSAADHIAQGPMQAHEMDWAPASDWPAAFNAALQPVSTADQNQSYVAGIPNVTVTTTATPEPSTWALMLGALLTLSSYAGTLAPLKQYCSGCHNSKTKSGGLAFDITDTRNPAVWEKIDHRLRARSMPPAGLPRPDEATYKDLLATIEKDLDSVAPNPGRTDTFRRLNRTEYQNSVRDLFLVDVDVTNLLPADESSHGFDNITVGDLSPTLLDRYLTAARRIVRLAMGSPVKAPGGDTFGLPPDLTQEEHFEDLPPGTRGGTVVKYTFPLDAEYDFQLRLARDRNEHVEGLQEPHDIEVTVDGERVKLFSVAPPPKNQDHHLVDEHLKVRFPVKAGPHTVAVAFIKKPSLLLESERQPYQAHFNMDRHPRIQPALYSLTVNGPFNSKGPGDSPSRRRILVCTPTKPSEEEPCARRIFSATMKRAYRRPVSDTDLQAPLRLYRQTRKDEGFEAGVELGLSAVLVSPEFLFRVEREPEGIAPKTAYRLTDIELATRLSFFLWSSIPDDELLDLAIKGDLHNPTVLNKQVSRMLADKRSRALITNFAEQWLHLRNLASITPDMRTFPDFDDNLRRAFREETQLFLESILREDRNVLDMLRAKYSFVNGRLAKHYGIPNVYGSRFRRVEFGANDVRGGLLRQGSILTVTSYATRTSPVIRGKWILDNILGTPPPPPPPFVPTLKENSGGLKNLPMRERIAEHRANPACASCHNIMDPLGFALENYDAVGRWRSTDENKPVDASGNLPDGTKFDGPAALQTALLNHPDIFVGTLSEKLLTYAVGRPADYYDGPATRRIVRDAAAADYRFSSIITGIVNSTPFQMRRSK
jgi:hypothetical protein